MANKVLIVASVAYMIKQFNMRSITMLLDMGFEVEVACNYIKGSPMTQNRIDELKKELRDLNVEMHQIDFERNPLNLSAILKSYGQVNAILRNRDYNFIHCHTPVGGLIARVAGRMNRVKVIYTAHGFHFYKGAPLINWIVYYPIEKFMSRFTEVLITMNDEDFELSKRKMKAKSVCYIPGVGIELHRFPAVDNDAKLKSRKHYNIDENAFVLIFVAELNETKNQMFLINSLSETLNKQENTQLLLVGRGDKHQCYKNRIRELSLENQIKLYGYREDIPELMQISDICISSSKREGLPLNLIEAMSVGLPLLVSNVRGNKDLVEHGVNGYIFDDENSLLDLYSKLRESKPTRIKFSLSSLDKVNKYKAKTVDNLLRKIYSDFYID